jgi:hypothetical protein
MAADGMRDVIPETGATSFRKPGSRLQPAGAELVLWHDQPFSKLARELGIGEDARE